MFQILCSVLCLYVTAAPREILTSGKFALKLSSSCKHRFWHSLAQEERVDFILSKTLMTWDTLYLLHRYVSEWCSTSASDPSNSLKQVKIKHKYGHYCTIYTNNNITDLILTYRLR